MIFFFLCMWDNYGASRVFTFCFDSYQIASICTRHPIFLVAILPLTKKKRLLCRDTFSFHINLRNECVLFFARFLPPFTFYHVANTQNV